MDHNNPAFRHAEFLRRINDDFGLSKIVLEKEGVNFDTNNISYWTVRKGEETVNVSPVGLENFIIARKTSFFEDSIEIPVYTDDYSKKYRDGDLHFFISEGFGLEKSESDVSKGDTKRFFNLAKKLLQHSDENVDLLLEINPRSLDAVITADVLYTMTGPLVLKYKENPTALSDLGNLRDKYNSLDKLDSNDPTKLNFLLDELESFVSRYKI
jgi:hypothetical protein